MTITLTNKEYKTLRYALINAARASKDGLEYADEILDLYENIIKQGWEQQ